MDAYRRLMAIIEPNMIIRPISFILNEKNGMLVNS
jgi:hypothetical protein